MIVFNLSYGVIQDSDLMEIFLDIRRPRTSFKQPRFGIRAELNRFQPEEIVIDGWR